MFLFYRIYNLIFSISKVKNHVSVIYINPTSRHIVTAFKGLTSNVSDLLLDRNLSNNSFQTFVANELASMVFYACVHSRVAIELSRQTGYGLSFTGYSYGAWLAELCVYFSYVSNDDLTVRAITFESPGSYEAIDKLNSVQVEIIFKSSFKIELVKLSYILDREPRS